MTQNSDRTLETKTTRIALLGLGTMGYAMAQRLASSGYNLTAWNRTPEKANGLREHGVALATSAAKATRSADIILLMLADDAAVLETARSIAGAVTDGATVIDLSTVHPETTAQLKELMPSGVTVVDAPVMGSADAAQNGSLGILVGATEHDFKQVEPTLSVMGRPTRVGGPGAGAAAKVAVMAAIIPGIVAVGEAFAVGRSLGLDEETLKSVFSHTPVAALTQRAFADQANYAARLAAKDLGLANRAAPTSVVTKTMETLQATTDGDDDLGRVARLLPATVSIG